MKTCCNALLLLLSLAQSAHAVVTLPSFFGDHMVLQRETPIKIWGQARPEQTVVVTFAGQSVSTTAGENGKWSLQLAPMKASMTPQPMTIKAAGEKQTTIDDVLIGDVWLGSGQSNMAGRVASYAKNDATLAALLNKAPFPQIRLMQSGPKPAWTHSTQENVARFSALHFAFGERLQRELDVPIGLIVGAVGGTPSGYWIPPQSYAASTRCQKIVAEYAKTYDREAVMRQYQAKLAVWERRAAIAKSKGEKPKGRKPAPPVTPGESSRGGKIGGLYQRYIEPVAGLPIRGVLWDQGEARSGVLGIDQHTMMSELIRGWREVWGQGDFPFLFVQKPSGGGCAMNNEDPITRNANAFVASLPTISRLGSGDQRFLYVRLMRDNKNAWMVPASDLGSGIHPTNKWGYGNRAAEIALSQVYRTGRQAYGPIYQSHRFEGKRAIVNFSQVGKGLVAAHADQLQGFALAGADDRWHWAQATIEGDQVILSAPQVSSPTRIRYGFAQNRAWANLFNKDGLPALAFEAGDSPANKTNSKTRKRTPKKTNEKTGKRRAKPQ